MKKLLLSIFILLPMFLSAQTLTPSFHKNGKWGYKESRFSEKYVIKPKFEKAHPFVGDYAFVCLNGFWGIIGKNGKFVVEPKIMDDASKPYGDITIVRLEGKYGLVKGKETALLFQYESIEPMKLGGFRLKKEGRYGLADNSGKVIVPVQYEEVSVYNNRYKLKDGGKCGLANSNGRIIIPVEYDDVSTYGNGYLLKANNCVGLADANGEVIIPVKYDDVVIWNKGYRLQSNGGVGLADASGKVIVKPKYKDVLRLQNDLFVVFSDKLEFIDSEGKVIEQPENVLLYTSKDSKIINLNEIITVAAAERPEECPVPAVVAVEVAATAVEAAEEVATVAPDPKRVQQIALNTYFNGYGIMVFDSSITSIGERAFYDCDNLTSITIPNSVTEIDSEAFCDCDNLASIAIPSSVTKIGDWAFCDCTLLTSVVIPNSVTSIGKGAFRNCDGLTSITIPNSVASIGGTAFKECSSLTSVVIPYGVTSIGYGVFRHCESLTRITIPNSVTSIGNRAFSGCSSLTSITIPNSVTSIGDRAFEKCVGLTSITIPNSVTKIGRYAFSNCDHLKAFYGRFASSDNRCLIVNGVLVALAGAGLTSYAIPSNVIAIEEVSFNGCKDLTSITIPSNVTSIDGRFFYRRELKDVYFKGSVPPAIKGHYYYDDDSMKIHVPKASFKAYWQAEWSTLFKRNIVIEAGCSIPENCIIKYTTTDGEKLWWTKYDSDSNLHSHTYENGVGKLYFYNEVTEIKEDAFRDKGRLRSVIIPNSVKKIGNAAFYKSGIESVVIPNSVVEIDEWAFGHCYSLKSAIIGNRVTRIGDMAFYSSALTKVSIGKNVERIGDEAFRYCENLTRVDIFDLSAWCKMDYDDIYGNPCCCGAELYLNGAKLTKLVIPSDITTIGFASFHGCRSLRSVVIGSQVTEICRYAFFNCTSLETVYCKPTTPPSLGRWAFEYDSGNTRGRLFRDNTDKPMPCKIFVPDASVLKYRYADVWENYIWNISGF